MTRRLKTVGKRGALALMTLVVFTGVGAAADWAERPYNPPVGSRWIIQRDLSKEERRVENGKQSVETSTMKITSELTIEAKTATGYRIAYRRIKSSYDGTGDDVAVGRAALAALDNVVFRASTDTSGKPLRVENIGEVQQAMRNMINSLAASGLTPQVAAGVRQLLDGLTRLDAEQAAQASLDEVPSLAVTQNTGLKPGETRRDAVSVPNGIGPPMVKNMVLSIVGTDATTGDARFALTENYERESIVAFLVALANKIGRDPEDMKKTDITLDARTEIDVAGGMTRATRRQSAMKSNLMGNTLTITDRKDVTVTPAK